MTKKELVAKVSKQTDITLKQAGMALESITDAIKSNLKKGRKVTLPGFGTFTISKRKARKGRNPRTGEIIKIASSRIAKFRPGKGLKDLLNR
ncbi:MAG: HU family DNA-binding protein [Thermodesulfovibrionales bacterium]